MYLFLLYLLLGRNTDVNMQFIYMDEYNSTLLVECVSVSFVTKYLTLKLSQTFSKLAQILKTKIKILKWTFGAKIKFADYLSHFLCYNPTALDEG